VHGPIVEPATEQPIRGSDLMQRRLHAGVEFMNSNSLTTRQHQLAGAFELRWCAGVGEWVEPQRLAVAMPVLVSGSAQLPIPVAAGMAGLDTAGQSLIVTKTMEPASQRPALALAHQAEIGTHGCAGA